MWSCNSCGGNKRIKTSKGYVCAECGKATQPKNEEEKKLSKIPIIPTIGTAGETYIRKGLF